MLHATENKKKDDKQFKNRDLAILALRLTSGGLLAGHGAQKLFGWFDGQGLKGTEKFIESLGLKPSERWAFAAGASEFGGGVLTTLGFLHPLGTIASIAAMVMAAGTAHRGKPIWSTQGGAELPLTNIAVSLALGLTGPGRLSLDRALGLKLPLPLVALIAGAAAGSVSLGLKQHLTETEDTPDEQPALPSENGKTQQRPDTHESKILATA